MMNHKDCPHCSGSGFKTVRRGIETCHERPPFFSGVPVDEGRRMVGG